MSEEPAACRRDECPEPAQAPGPFCPTHRREHARDVLADMRHWAQRDALDGDKPAG